MVKNILRGKTMKKVVTWIQTMAILAPTLVPVAGGGLALWETRARCHTGLGFPRPRTDFRGLARAGLQRAAPAFSAMSMPFMAYLAVSSYVFQNRFGLSAQEHSCFFAFNAGMSLLGHLAAHAGFPALAAGRGQCRPSAAGLSGREAAVALR